MSCLWRLCVFSVVKHSHVFCVFLQRAGPTTTKPKASPSSHSYGHLHSKCKQRGHLTICSNTAVSSLLTLCQATTCPFVLEASLPELWDVRTSRIKQRSMWMRGAFIADHLDTVWGDIKADATGSGRGGKVKLLSHVRCCSSERSTVVRVLLYSSKWRRCWSATCCSECFEITKSPRLRVKRHK